MNNISSQSAGLRNNLCFLLAGVAVLLRLASDWISPRGWPLAYQIVQAVLLLLAIVALWPRIEMIFLKGGAVKHSLFEGLLALPIGLLAGLGMVWLRQGELQWPTFQTMMVLVLNNLFFPAVEELEFRGFLLGWMVNKKVPQRTAYWLVAIIHTLAHVHRVWKGDYLTLVTTLFFTAWLGSLTCRTRCIWGAYLAHSLFNIFTFLPLIGIGIWRI